MISSVRHLAHRRHQIIGECDGERIAAFVVGELLHQRAAEALREAAGDLALDQRRIDGAADVIADDVAQHLSRRRCRDRPSPPRGDCRTDRPGGRRRTSLRPTAPARGRRAAWSLAPSAAAILPSGLDGPPTRPAITTSPLTMSSVSAGDCISSAAMFSAFSRTLSAATRVAEAVITVAREACAPMPCSMRSVWPWMTRIFL